MYICAALYNDVQLGEDELAADGLMSLLHFLERRTAQMNSYCARFAHGCIYRSVSVTTSKRALTHHSLHLPWTFDHVVARKLKQYPSDTCQSAANLGVHMLILKA